MSVTIVMHKGQTLHLQNASAAQLKELRENLKAGSGSFEFTTEDRSYIVNCASVAYIEVTPASALRP